MKQPKLDWCQFTFWSGFICSIYNALWVQYQPPLHLSINGWATNKNINEIDVANNIPLSNGLAITHTQQKQNILLTLGVHTWLIIIKLRFKEKNNLLLKLKLLPNYKIERRRSSVEMFSVLALLAFPFGCIIIVHVPVLYWLQWQTSCIEYWHWYMTMLTNCPNCTNTLNVN